MSSESRDAASVLQDDHVLGHFLRNSMSAVIHEIQHEEELKTPITKRDVQSLIALPYKERMRLMNIFFTSEKNKMPLEHDGLHHRDFSFLLMASMPYPKQLMEIDQNRMPIMARQAEKHIRTLEQVLDNHDSKGLCDVFENVCRDLVSETVGSWYLSRLGIYSFTRKRDEEMRYVPTAEFNSNGGRLSIGFNISDDAFKHSPYYRSGLEAACVSVHEVTHLEQYIRFVEPSLPGFIERKIISRPSADFNRFGDDFYTQPEDHLLLYLANPKERQARYRQYSVLDLLNGCTIKPEKEYFEAYLEPRLPNHLKPKMEQIYQYT